MSAAVQLATTVRFDALSIRILLPGRERRWVHAAEDVSLGLEPGRVTAVVGESGCGKSLLALALMGLLPAGTFTRGSIHYGDVDLLTAPTSLMRSIRGVGLGLIPQSAATHLNPVRTVRATMAETLTFHGHPAETADLQALLTDFALPADTLDRYPHAVGRNGPTRPGGDDPRAATRGDRRRRADLGTGC
ncbi:ATP-binding cassette domain-containing protein [Aeromicrobium sp. UC242_57]|uniref:ATP-binding cassette domain-containing protein n=1 Tax=Aeromicrobium sp. UC242_57 TaxID=3374624 RepID=UPI0037BCEAC5